MSHTFATFAKSGQTVSKRRVDGVSIEMLPGDTCEKVWKEHYVVTCPENAAQAIKAVERRCSRGKKARPTVEST